MEIVAALGIDGIDGRRPGERKIRPCRAVKAVLQRIVLHLELHSESGADIQFGAVRRSSTTRAKLHIAQIPLIQVIVQHGRHTEVVPALADDKAGERNLKALVLFNGFSVHGEQGMTIGNGVACLDNAGLGVRKAARNVRQRPVSRFLHVTDFGHGIVEVVKLITAQFADRIPIAVFQHQPIDIAADWLIGNRCNAHASNRDGSAFRTDTGHDGSKGIGICIACENSRRRQLCQKRLACSQRQVELVIRFRGASEATIPLDDAAAGAVILHHGHMDFHREGFVGVGKGHVDGAAGAVRRIGVHIGRFGIGCAVYVDRGCERVVRRLRELGGLSSHRCCGSYSPSVFINFYRIADLYRRTVEQDRRVGLTVFEDIGLISRSGCIKDSGWITCGCRYRRFAAVLPFIIAVLNLCLHGYRGCGGCRHQKVKGERRIHDSAGSYGLFVKHDHRGLLGIIDHIELRRITAARPDCVIPGLRRVFKSSPCVPDPQCRYGVVCADSIRNQAQVGSVHFRSAVDAADGKCIVRVVGRKAQRVVKLGRHAVFAEERVRRCGRSFGSRHVRKHTACFHALVADVQRLFLIVDEIQFSSLAEDSERRFVLVFHEHLLVFVFDRRDRVAFGNGIQVAGNSGESKRIVFGRRRHMTCAVQLRRRGGHCDVPDRPISILGFIHQSRSGCIHRMDGYDVCFLPIGVQIQRTRDRLRKVVLCINLFRSFSRPRCPVTEQAFIGSRVNRNFCRLSHNRSEICGLGIDFGFPIICVG